MDLENSKTFENLKKAFAGESQAANKYTYFAEKAKAEGYGEIADCFLETAKNEQAHAKLWYNLLEGVKSTSENLATAIDGEHHEWTLMYAQMSNDARNEGFMTLAMQMEQVAKIEKLHEDRFKALLDNVNNNQAFSYEGPVSWICEICGYEYTANQAKGCPVCGASAKSMIIKKENWK